MPGNLRRKTGRKGSGVTEKDYLRAREQVIRRSSICAICQGALDKTLRPICRRVDTSGYTVENGHEIPTICGPDCDKSHGTKAHPFGPSADHIVQVSRLLPGDRRLTDPANLRAVHNVCNRSRGNREDKPKTRVSKDWYQ